MRSRTLVAAAVLGGLVALPAFAEDGYRHGRVRFVEPGVTLQRATEVSAEEALANLPFLPGDRVWTDTAGRAEMQFPDGTIVRVDRRSKLDYAGHEEGQDERIVLRLWSGSALVRVRSRGFARFEIETPAGMVQALDRGIVRVDVEAGETRVSVYAGEAVLDDGRRQVRLASGERTWARWGAEAEEPRRFDPGEDDEFARWDGLRESEDRWAARSAEYLPDELDAYAGEFEANGAWQYEGTSGYVWVPRVAVGWQPYSNGHWTWTPYGWTWVPYERWGWAPSHYGRWGFSASFGWYWAPGRTWGPGWVSWAVGGGYVGWCPLGWRNRPVHPWGWSGHGGSAATRVTRCRGEAAGTAAPGTSCGRATWEVATWRDAASRSTGSTPPRCGRRARTQPGPPATGAGSARATRSRARSAAGRRPATSCASWASTTGPRSRRPGRAATGLPRREWTARARARSGARRAGSPAPAWPRHPGAARPAGRGERPRAERPPRDGPHGRPPGTPRAARPKPVSARRRPAVCLRAEPSAAGRARSSGSPNAREAASASRRPSARSAHSRPTGPAREPAATEAAARPATTARAAPAPGRRERAAAISPGAEASPRGAPGPGRREPPPGRARRVAAGSPAGAAARTRAPRAAARAGRRAAPRAGRRAAAGMPLRARPAIASSSPAGGVRAGRS